jgi:hypothetical protein
MGKGVSIPWMVIHNARCSGFNIPLEGVNIPLLYCLTHNIRHEGGWFVLAR